MPLLRHRFTFYTSLTADPTICRERRLTLVILSTWNPAQRNTDMAQTNRVVTRNLVSRRSEDNVSHSKEGDSTVIIRATVVRATARHAGEERFPTR